MPTQEERLSALERFQKEAAAHIRETEENTTILLGVIRDQGRDIKRIVQHLETIDGHLDSLDSRFETVDGRLVSLDGRLNTLESRCETQEQQIERLEQSVNNRFEVQDKKLDQILLVLTMLTTKPDQED